MWPFHTTKGLSRNLSASTSESLMPTRARFEQKTACRRIFSRVSQEPSFLPTEWFLGRLHLHGRLSLTFHSPGDKKSLSHMKERPGLPLGVVSAFLKKWKLESLRFGNCRSRPEISFRSAAWWNRSRPGLAASAKQKPGCVPESSLFSPPQSNFMARDFNLRTHAATGSCNANVCGRPK